MIKKGQKLIRNNKDYVSEDDRSANRWFISIMIILVAICTVGVVSMATGWPTNVSTGGGSTESVEVVNNETDTETTEGEAAGGDDSATTEATESADGEGEATTEEDGSESAETENSGESAEAESGENTEENAGEESGDAQEQSEDGSQQ